jgi:hypothetical protein
MKYVELSDTQVSNDCVVIWNYLKDNPGVTLTELKAKFSGPKWSKDRKWVKSFCSNLVYVIKRLRRVGAIEIIQNRSSGGEFDYATINLTAEPIIRKNLLVCTDCGNEFKKKSSTAKYKDLCLKCTERKFMTSKNALCVYCKTYGTKNKMSCFKSELYHKECFRKYRDLKREAKVEALAQLNKKKRYCQVCNETEISKFSKFCKGCREKNNEQRRKKSCFSCGIKLDKLRYNTCDSIDCRAVYYAKSDAYFNGRKSDNDLPFVLKKKMLGESCAVCGYDTFIHYHHVIFRENGGKDVMSNILPVCPNHHMEIHHRGLDVSEQHKVLLKRLDDIANGLIKITLY